MMSAYWAEIAAGYIAVLVFMSFALGVPGLFMVGVREAAAAVASVWAFGFVIAAAFAVAWMTFKFLAGVLA